MKFRIILGMVTFIFIIIGILLLGMEYMWINYALITWASVDIGLNLVDHFGLNFGLKRSKFNNLKKRVKEVEDRK